MAAPRGGGAVAVLRLRCGCHTLLFALLGALLGACAAAKTLHGALRGSNAPASASAGGAAALGEPWALSCAAAPAEGTAIFDPFQCCGAHAAQGTPAGGRHAIAYVYDRLPVPPKVIRQINVSASAARAAHAADVARGLKLDVLLLLPTPASGAEAEAEAEADEAAATFEAADGGDIGEGGDDPLGFLGDFAPLAFMPRLLRMPLAEGDVPLAQREALKRSGNCCGWREYFKLAAWTLEEYGRVVVLDSDAVPRASLAELFSCRGDEVLFTSGPWAPFNTGMFALRPSREDLREMLRSLVGSTYDDRSGWGGVKYRGWNQESSSWTNGWKAVGAEGPQGFLHWYWAVQRPERSRRLNGCVYNYIQTFMCPRKALVSELNAHAKVVHKLFCARPVARAPAALPIVHEFEFESSGSDKACAKGADAAIQPWLRFPGLTFSARQDLMPQELSDAIDAVRQRFGGNLTAALLAVAANQTQPT